MKTKNCRRWLLAALTLAVLTAGCRSSRRVATPPAPPEPQAEAPAPQRTYTVMNFSGEAEGLTVNGQLRVAQDSAMWLSVNKIFEVARALATQDSLFLRAPLLGYEVATDYADLQRRTGRKMSYADLQALALEPDAEEKISALARELGFDVKVAIGVRRQVEHLSLPYPKTPMP